MLTKYQWCNFLVTMLSTINSGLNNDCASARPALNRNSNEARNWHACFFSCLQKFTRFWGVFTAIVLCGVGVDISFRRHLTGYYLIAASALVFWFEITWAITLFLQVCVRNEHSRIFRCWASIQWVEEWKKSLLYGPLGAVPIVWPHKLWLSYVAGGQLIALAVFHLILTFKERKRRRRKDRLLHGDIDSFESSKFEEVTEVLDDGLPEPIPGSSHSLSDSLAEQDTILEI